MIADDIRATTVYKPQDTSAIAQLMAKTAQFDVDDIDKATAALAGGLASSALSSSVRRSRHDLGSHRAAPASRAGPAQRPLPPRHRADRPKPTPRCRSVLTAVRTRTVRRCHASAEARRAFRHHDRLHECTVAGLERRIAGAGTSSGGVPATDLKTVHYFIRPGEAVEAGSASVTSLDPASQARIGGLVRQEIPRAMRNFAEKNGGSDVLDSNAVLLAPEVVRMEIRFFNGSEIADTWDMKEQKSLPVAVEVCIWLRSPNATNEPITANYDTATLASSTHEYRQVVYLPMAQVANAAQSQQLDEYVDDRFDQFNRHVVRRHIGLLGRNSNNSQSACERRLRRR